MSEKSYQKLLSVVGDFEKKSIKKIAVELQRTPDPDAIASALVVKDVINKTGDYKVDITHSSPISDARNRLMIKELGISDLVCYKNGRVKSPDYDAFFFVDHSGNTSDWYDEGKIPEEKICGIIDHHDLDKEVPKSVPFVDKRKVGSCASIVTSYIIDGLYNDLGVVIEKNVDFEKIANALLLGIRADTKQLTDKNTTQFDHEAAEFLKKYANLPLINRIENPKVESEIIDLLGKAISSRESKNGIMICFLGFIQPNQHDVLPRAAETLLTQKGIHTVYSIGIQPDIIDVSIRTEDPDYDFSKLEELFSEGRSGGKEGAGGLQIPNPLKGSFLSREDDERKRAIEFIVLDEFKKRLFK